MFSKYARGSGSEEGKARAARGLGLAKCKGLVEAHGGRIWAESGVAGEGTRISFMIPAADPAATGALTVSTGLDRREQDGQRILVVDDDPDTLRYVRGALVSAGYSPILTGNPQKVASLIKRRKLQLVLMDLVLPGADGIELMQQLRAMADLPVIFISAYGRDETIARALESGAADYPLTAS